MIWLMCEASIAIFAVVHIISGWVHQPPKVVSMYHRFMSKSHVNLKMDATEINMVKDGQSRIIT
jgi:hypothetical protein